MLKKIIQIYWQFKEYNQLLGIKDSLSFILFELLKKEKEKIINVHNELICIRTGSPDLKVAIRTLFNSEFDDINMKNPSVIVDAGAYIGTSAIFFCKKYPTAIIYAIEPEDGNFKILEKNTRKFKNIIPIKAALWSDNETRMIQNRHTGHWGYTISDTFNETSSTNQKINCVTLSDIMRKYDINYIDILKMDIEGSEKRILEASNDWINKVKIITVELHDSIVEGCEKAFYISTKDFVRFEKKGEKITAYRDLKKTLDQESL